MDNGMVIGGLAGSSGGVQGDAGLEEGGEGDGHFRWGVSDGRTGKKGVVVILWVRLVKCRRRLLDMCCIGWMVRWYGDDALLKNNNYGIVTTEQ